MEMRVIRAGRMTYVIRNGRLYGSHLPEEGAEILKICAMERDKPFDIEVRIRNRWIRITSGKPVEEITKVPDRPEHFCLCTAGGLHCPFAGHPGHYPKVDWKDEERPTQFFAAEISSPSSDNGTEWKSDRSPWEISGEDRGTIPYCP